MTPSPSLRTSRKKNAPWQRPAICTDENQSGFATPNAQVKGAAPPKAGTSALEPLVGRHSRQPALLVAWSRLTGEAENICIAGTCAVKRRTRAAKSPQQRRPACRTKGRKKVSLLPAPTRRSTSECGGRCPLGLQRTSELLFALQR